MTERQIGWGRLGLAVLTVAVLAWAVLSGRYGLALTAGIAVGGLLFLFGMTAGGSLGNARRFEKKPADINARVGTLLAAAGIASAALGHDPPFPAPFRVFYGFCLGLACLGAVALATMAVRKPGE